MMGLPIGTYMRCVAGLAGMDQVFLIQTPVTKIISPQALRIATVLIFLTAVISILWFLVVAYKRFAKEKRLKEEKFSATEILIYFSLFAVMPMIFSIILNILFKTPLALRYFAVSSAFLVFVYALALFSIKNKKALFSLIVGIFIIVSIARLIDFTKAVIDYKNSSLFVKNNIKAEEGLLFIGGENAYRYYSEMPENYISSVDYIRNYGIDTGSSLEYLINEEVLRASIRPFKILWIYNSGEKMTGLREYVLGLIDHFGYKKIGEYKFKNISVFKYARKI